MEDSSTFDVVIIGGALSGAATALQLLRKRPELKVAVIEKSAVHGRRVGESTVETSGYFLGKTLGLASYLNREHILKQGLRFYFANDRTQSLYDCSEVGPIYNTRLLSYQLDRARMDEEVLARSVTAGAHLFRPAKVEKVELREGGPQQISFRDDSATVRTLEARWVIDASGQASLIGRKKGLIQRNDRHPIASVWARFSGVKDWDCPSHRANDSDWSKRIHTTRGSATNHIMGDGYWIWIIPLASGNHSVGLVYDTRMVDFPKEGSLSNRLLQFVREHPAGNSILEHAQPVEGDAHARSRFAYCAETLMGDGWALVGDAAAFMDPFYSPGMDWIAFTTGATAALIADEASSASLQKRIDIHNATFVKSYWRWFAAIYENKYRYFNEADLVSLAFRFDLGTYYLGVVQPLLTSSNPNWMQPPFSHRNATIPFRIIRHFNRRMAAIAESRRQRGIAGRFNHGLWKPFMSYTFNATLPVRLAILFLEWGRLELCEGWRSWFKPQPAPASLHPAVQQKAE